MLPTALLGTVSIPPLVYVLFGTSSMAAGVAIVAAMWLFAFLAFGSMLPTKRLFACAIGTGIALSLVVSLSVPSLFTIRDFDGSRHLLSLALLTLVMSGAFSLARMAGEVSDGKANSALKFVCAVLLASGCAAVLGYAPLMSDRFPISVSFFAERSHFALSFLPFLLYSIVISRRTRSKVFLVTLGFALGLTIENLTLIVGTAMIALIALRLRYTLPLMAICAALAASGLLGELPDLSYYAQRIDLTPDSENLSVLAYLQSWERAYVDFVRSNGLGVGFQQFGVVGEDTPIQKEIVAIVGKDLNREGSTIGAKLVGDFGVVGVALLVAYVAFAGKIALWLRRVSRRGYHGSRDIFFASCAVMYSIDMFVRGTGYFSPTGFLFLSAVYWMALWPLQNGIGHHTHTRTNSVVARSAAA